MPWVFILHGILGGITYILVQTIKAEESTSKYNILNKELCIKYGARLLLGGIMGFFVYSFGLPDSITAASVGYVGVDAVEVIFKRSTKERKDKYMIKKL